VGLARDHELGGPRAATAHARRDRRDELAAVVTSFGEGLDTADVREANRVLAELA